MTGLERVHAVAVPVLIGSTLLVAAFETLVFRACEQTVYSRALSRDGALEAAVSMTDCGAMTSFRYRVTIGPAAWGALPAPMDGNVVVVSPGTERVPTIVWEGERDLRVGLAASDRASLWRDSVLGASVTLERVP